MCHAPCTGEPSGSAITFWTVFLFWSYPSQLTFIATMSASAVQPPGSVTRCSTTSISVPAVPGSPRGFPTLGDRSQNAHQLPGASWNRMRAAKYP